MVEPLPGAVNFGPAPGSTIRPGGAVGAWLARRSRSLPPWRHLSMRLMPPRCLFCGQGADLGAVDLCDDCLQVLPWLDPVSDDGAARETKAGSEATIASGSVVIPFRYAPPIAAALRDLKFHGDLAPAKALGAVLAAAAALRGDLPDLLVPVPLHPDRLHERGFNQAGQLARAAAGWLGRPCAPRLLERSRATLPQTSLDAAARRRNLQGAFRPGPDADRWLHRSASPVRHVALVDDVLTTGATISAAAQALPGPARLSFWAVARPASTFLTPGDELA